MAASEWVAVKLEVRDKAKFIADMEASGLAVRKFGREAERTGGLMSTGAHHSFLWNQALFTLRRTLYGVTLAAGALTAAVVVLGFQYNSMIEQQTLAFTKFTGSAAAANDEVTFLFNLAAHGPFTFDQVLAGARQLLAFGSTVEDTNALLTSLQDAMAAMGLDSAAMNRATLAIGQIQSSGRLLGQDLRQLEQLGLVNPEDLARRLGINASQIGNIGALNVPSKVAIDAIKAYWDQRFGGAAADFQKTWVGELSTLKDLSSRLFGSWMKPLQDYLEEHTIPTLTEMVTILQSGFDTGGFTGGLQAFDEHFGTNLLTIFEKVAGAGKQVWTIITVIGQSFYDAFKLLHPFYTILVPLVGILYALAAVLKVLQPILKFIIALWIAERTAILGVWAAEKLLLIARGLETAIVGGKLARALRILIGLRKVEAGMSLLAILKPRQWLYGTQLVMDYAGGYKKVFVNEGKFAVFTRKILGNLAAIRTAFLLATAAVWDFTIALFATPPGWVALGVLALTAGLVILYFKWKRFHDLVDKTYHLIGRNKIAFGQMFVPMFAPLIRAIGMVQKLWDTTRKFYNWITGNTIKHDATSGSFWSGIGKIILNRATGGWAGFAQNAVGIGKKGVNWIPGFADGGTMTHSGLAIVGERGPELLSLPGGSLITNIPAFATGGKQKKTGAAIVGEKGPEMVTLPAGAEISPLGTGLAHISHISAVAKRGVLNVTIPLTLDRRQIALATASYNLDELANA